MLRLSGRQALGSMLTVGSGVAVKTVTVPCAEGVGPEAPERSKVGVASKDWAGRVVATKVTKIKMSIARARRKNKVMAD
jgi:hypothetical protein